MKRIFAFALAALMLLSLAACSGKKDTDEELIELEEEAAAKTVYVAGSETYYYDAIDTETVIITGYASGSALHTLNIPSEIEGKSVVSIADGAFRTVSCINAIVIPTTVKNIGEFAFADCAEVLSVSMPQVETFGAGAFYGCTKLASLTIADGADLTEIPDYAFMNCRALTSVTLPSGVKTVGKAAFFACVELTSLTLGAGVEKIGDNAFMNCEKLTTPTLGAGVTVGDNAFTGCLTKAPD